MAIKNLILMNHNYKPSREIKNPSHALLGTVDKWISPEGKEMSLDGAIDEVWEKFYRK